MRHPLLWIPHIPGHLLPADLFDVFPSPDNEKKVNLVHKEEWLGAGRSPEASHTSVARLFGQKAARAAFW